ncbi:MAG: glycosyltransferase family A protein [Coriobacteriaceae bacterium]|nr:glycosyltransferase family A protein [Coriobacteriaceae bacterium]
MAHRSQRGPRVSVALAACNAADHIGRAIESVLNQSFESLELIIVDCGSTDRTRAICDRYAERDFRVDVLSQDSPDLSSARGRALVRAQGDYLIFVNQDDWLGSGLLDTMVSAADESDADLVMAEFAIDSEREQCGRVSSILAPAPNVWRSREEVRSGAVSLIESGTLSFVSGKLLRRARVVETCRTFETPCTEDAQFMIVYMRDLERASVVEGARYHLFYQGSQVNDAFDEHMFDRCEREFNRLYQLYGYWGLLCDSDAVASLNRRHLRDVIRCIENAAVGTGAHIPAPTRRALIQKIVDSETTRRCAASLKNDGHEFGIMYLPILKRNAGACLHSAHIQDLVSRCVSSFMPSSAFVRV